MFPAYLYGRFCKVKKTALIFLVFVYVLSSTGVSVKAFYCCEKLKSVKLTLATNENSNDGCCKTIYQSLKIKDTHVMADAIIAPALHHLAQLPFTSPPCEDFSAEPTKVMGSIHAPPLHRGVPAYISDCVYRI